MTFPLNRVREIAENIDLLFDEVNSGGCGVVAALLAKELRKFTSVDIVVHNHMGSKSIPELRELCDSVDEWYSHGFSVTHMWVEFEILGVRYAIDSTGIQPVKWIYADWGDVLLGALTDDETEELLKVGRWNSYFSRRQIPAMEQYVAHEFEGVAVQ